MATIRIHQGKRGTTIRMKAGRGEDLRHVVERLAGKDYNGPRKEYKSNAQWPLDVYRGIDGSGISADDHYTREEAANVCRMLRRDGFGGQGIYFPLRVWVTGPDGEVIWL